MLARVGGLGIGLVVIVGCRGGAESQAGEGAREAEGVRSGAEPSAEPKPEPQPEPVETPRPVLKPEPVVMPELGELDAADEPDAAVGRDPTPDAATPAAGAIRIEGRTVAARIEEEDRDENAPEDPDEEPPPPKRMLVVSIDGATTGDGLLSLPTELGECESSEVVVEPVPGEASSLVLAQALCEFGADYFSREIFAAVIHVGSPTAAPRVLWQGKGRYASSFGVCEEIDVPIAKVTTPGTLVVEQHTEVVENRNPDGLGVECKRKRLKVRTLVEVGF